MRHGIAQAPGGTEPTTTEPVFYVVGTFTESLPRWRALTGLNSNATPEELANAYVAVVKKKARRGSSQSRDEFSAWFSKNTDPPTAFQQEILEELLDEGAFGIEVGPVIEHLTPDASEQALTVDYFVQVDPALTRAPPEAPAPTPPPPVPAPAEAQVQPSPLVPFLIGFTLVGIGTAALVPKGAGLKALAATAGGLMGGVVAVGIAREVGKKESA